MKGPAKNIDASARSATGLMLATLVSRLLGFLRIGTISFLFGASTQADIIHLVFNIPNNLRKLLAEGALSAAFIPVFSAAIINDPSRVQARRIAENLFTFQFLILLPLLVVSLLSPETILRIFLDFQDPEILTVAAELFRYVIHYILFVSISAVIMGVLNTNDVFIIPGLTPILFSMSVIGCLFLFYQALGIFSIAVGVLCGGVFQIFFQLPRFIRLGYRLRFNFNFNNPEFKQILRRWLPVLCSSAILAINQQIAARFASAMESGSASAMSNALVFWQLPYGLFSASIVTVLFPRMSKQIAAGQRSETAKTLEFGISALMAFLIPSSVGLMLMAPELISTALQRGQFGLEHTYLASEVLFWYSPGLVFVGITAFLQRLFLSDGDTRTPLINAIIITGLDIILSLWLKETVLQVRGLALAHTVSYALATIWLLSLARKRFIHIRLRPLARDFFKILLAIFPACLIMIGGRVLFGSYWEEGSSFINLLKFLAVALPAMVSIVLMFLAVDIKAIYLLIRKKQGTNR